VEVGAGKAGEEEGKVVVAEATEEEVAEATEVEVAEVTEEEVVVDTEAAVVTGNTIKSICSVYVCVWNCVHGFPLKSYLHGIMFAMSNPNTRHHIVLHYFVKFFFASLALKI